MELMHSEPAIPLGGAPIPPELLLRFGNRHGLIAGATGTGKTVSLQVLAEGFSRAGVPVFMADVKGDLAGISQPGKPHPKIADRLAKMQIPDYKHAGNPTVCWDLYGKHGFPIRTTVSEMGPVLLSRLLELNETQEGVLNIAFTVADAEGLLLLDLDDLRAIMQYVSEHSADISSKYGNVSKASIGAIMRRVLVLEQQGAKQFFGEPALELKDFMRVSRGKGHINLLDGRELMQSPKLYATFLLWLLSELFEELPEVGDQPKPKLVFIFDEAHLLFADAPKALVDKVSQVVRLIRSKGVGVYFVSQNPSDLPDEVLGQLGNRIQHALRAFTPRDRKAVKAAAQTFRPNPKLDLELTIGNLGVGEALVSTLDPEGIPTIVQRTLMAPPRSRLGPITAAERKALQEQQTWAHKYIASIDRESAHEVLQKRAKKPRAATKAAQKAKPAPRTAATRKRSRKGAGDAFAKSAARAVGTQLGRGFGRSIMRGLLGSILK